MNNPLETLDTSSMKKAKVNATTNPMNQLNDRSRSLVEQIQQKNDMMFLKKYVEFLANYIVGRFERLEKIINELVTHTGLSSDPKTESAYYDYHRTRMDYINPYAYILRGGARRTRRRKTRGRRRASMKAGSRR
jgi:hypothetical protein